VLVIVVAVAVSVVGVAFDRILLHEGIPRYDLLGISNSLTGIVAGAFFWQAMRRERERRELVRERLSVIAEMNHHIRNALQVISFYSDRKQDAETLAMLQQAVTRIEWALKEVLPGEHVEDFARAGLSDQLQSRRRG
jgi:signal transduction histidine kinase